MSRVYVSAVQRGSEDRKLTGFVYEIDFYGGKILNQVSIPEPTLGDSFWNSRGGNRGARGMSFYNDILYVATATTVRKYNSDLCYLGSINNEKFGGLHSVYVDSSGVLVTSTIHDAIIKTDFDGNELWWWDGCKCDCVQKHFGVLERELKFDYNFSGDEYRQYVNSEKLHLSGLHVDNGTVHVLSNKQKSLIKIRPEPEVVFSDKGLLAPHDVEMANNQVVMNDTKNQRLVLYDIASGKRTKTIDTVMYDSRSVNQFSTAGWQRGLSHFYGSTYLVGTSPFTIFSVDLKAGVEKKTEFSDDVTLCPYDICVVNTN